jgi:uncharacterized protein YdaU (DUF1376 family)
VILPSLTAFSSLRAATIRPKIAVRCNMRRNPTDLSRRPQCGSALSQSSHRITFYTRVSPVRRYAGVPITTYFPLKTNYLFDPQAQGLLDGGLARCATSHVFPIGHAMHYYYRYLGDYAKDTTHLNQAKNGAYNFLLDRYYATERGIPVDEAYDVARAHTRAERQATDAVLAEFFVNQDGIWTNAKCEKEIAKYRTRSEKAKGSANARWHPEGNANASETHMPSHCVGNALKPLNLQSSNKEKESEDQKGPFENPKAPEFRKAVGAIAAAHRMPRG